METKTDLKFIVIKDKELYDKYNGMFSKTDSDYGDLSYLVKEHNSNLNGYFFFYKGIRAEIEMMKPLDYLQICADNMGYKDIFLCNSDYKRDSIISYMETGEKLNMPYYSIGECGGFSQEGRNRSEVAYNNGEEFIPVCRIYRVSTEEKLEKLEEILDYIGSTDIEQVLSTMKNLNYHHDALIFMKSYLIVGNIDSPYNYI